MSDMVVRDYEEHLRVNSEKSSAMDAKYQESSDPWGNLARNLYDAPILNLVDKIKDQFQSTEHIRWFDVGCGGGAVGSAVIKAWEHHCLWYYTLTGCDISESAISQNVFYESPQVADLEELTPETAKELFKSSNVVTFIEVLYYLGTKRPWKETVDIIWDSLDAGTLVVVADGLIPYQYRDYLASKDNATVLHKYTDDSIVISEEVTSQGKKWQRRLKVRVYRKD